MREKTIEIIMQPNESSADLLRRHPKLFETTPNPEPLEDFDLALLESADAWKEYEERLAECRAAVTRIVQDSASESARRRAGW